MYHKFIIILSYKEYYNHNITANSNIRKNASLCKQSNVKVKVKREVFI